ncbi:hypothetical protein E4U40_006974 [Claviceps sp. LM458 group G5]|nr:hypothetical protein E4U40_006974 [Claviceps sp. LM458 group G5]KAG6046965.1 hypothetical protein E4U39_000893 [Claviceps sp. Clav50 group G5]
MPSPCPPLLAGLLQAAAVDDDDDDDDGDEHVADLTPVHISDDSTRPGADPGTGGVATRGAPRVANPWPDVVNGPQRGQKVGVAPQCTRAGEPLSAVEME